MLFSDTMYPDYSFPYLNLALEDCCHESREDSCTEKKDETTGLMQYFSLVITFVTERS